MVIKISHDDKLVIARLTKDGHTVKGILKMLHEKGSEVSYKQVHYWHNKYICGYFDPECASEDRRKCAKMCQRDLQVVRKSLAVNRHQSCKDIQRVLKDDGADLSMNSTRTLIDMAGYTSEIPRYAQMVKEKNREARILFCERLIETNDTMDNIIFTDESSVQLHTSRTVSFRPKDGIGYSIPKPKHPLKLHVWGGISRRGPTQLIIFDGIMDSVFFTMAILEETLLPFVKETYPDGHRFQQDNDPKHRSNLSKRFMADNGINWWNVWPSESPDLNPIEMVWNQLKQNVAKEDPRTKEALTDCLHNFWDNTMTVELCNRYIDHVYKVAPVCVQMKGRATGDAPPKIFKERSEGRDFRYFKDRMDSHEVQERLQQLDV